MHEHKAMHIQVFFFQDKNVNFGQKSGQERKRKTYTLLHFNNEGTITIATITITCGSLHSPSTELTAV